MSNDPHGMSLTVMQAKSSIYNRFVVHYCIIYFDDYYHSDITNDHKNVSSSFSQL